MKKPYIFGHRGAMGYEIENTMNSFERAVETGAGIETDLHLTKENKIICIHDKTFRIDSKCYDVSELSLNQINEIKFEDNRKIPLLIDVFMRFKGNHNDLRYSFDIGNELVGMELINLALEFDILDKIVITDTRLNILSILRQFNDVVKLVYTLPYDILVIRPEFLDFNDIFDLNIHAINLNVEQTVENANLTQIADNGLNCYVWDVNCEPWMTNLLNWKYNERVIDAIYTNYPDVLMFMKKITCS